MMGVSSVGLGAAGLLAFWLFSASGPEVAPTGNRASRPQASVAEKGIVPSGIEESGLLVQEMPWGGFAAETGKETPAGAEAVEARMDGSAGSGMEDGEGSGCDEGALEAAAPGSCGATAPVEIGAYGSAKRSVLAAYKDLVRERREVGEFNRIVLRGVMDLTIKQGAQREVVVEATAEQQERLEIGTEGKTLVLDTDRSQGKNRWKLPKGKAVKVIVTVTDLKGIDHVGVGDILSDGALEQDALKVDFSGVGDMDLNLNCEDLIISHSGVGDTNLAGKAGRAKLAHSGVGDLDALSFPVRKMNVSASGVGMTKVHATDELIVEFSGVGGVRYEGEPKTKHIQSSGVGKVSRQ